LNRAYYVTETNGHFLLLRYPEVAVVINCTCETLCRMMVQKTEPEETAYYEGLKTKQFSLNIT
jgi:hypothetical protein